MELNVLILFIVMHGSCIFISHAYHKYFVTLLMTIIGLIGLIEFIFFVPNLKSFESSRLLLHMSKLNFLLLLKDFDREYMFTELYNFFNEKDIL